MKSLIFASLCALFFLAGCSFKPIAVVPPLEKLQNESEFYGSANYGFCDDEQFLKALDASIGFYKKSQATVFEFGESKFDGLKMANSLQNLRKRCDDGERGATLTKWMGENFSVYASRNPDYRALITGYYAPVMQGSLAKTEKFNVPLYGVPKDIIAAPLRPFLKNPPKSDIMGRVVDGSFVPYHTREQIRGGALGGQEPLLYLSDEVEAFFLEIQGSGLVRFEDNSSVYVLYAGKNGHPYVSIGKLMIQKGMLGENNASMQSIRDYLSANESVKHEVLNQNPSYVFFRLGNGPVVGNIGTPLAAKKSIAMDSRLIPKGALAFLRTTLPDKSAFESFMLVQDTGGAIKGGGRVDLYFGEGDEAAAIAGRMKQNGEVYILAPK